jgi:hypothetical protein
MNHEARRVVVGYEVLTEVVMLPTCFILVSYFVYYSALKWRRNILPKLQSTFTGLYAFNPR